MSSAIQNLQNLYRFRELESELLLPIVYNGSPVISYPLTFWVRHSMTNKNPKSRNVYKNHLKDVRHPSTGTSLATLQQLHTSTVRVSSCVLSQVSTKPPVSPQASIKTQGCPHYRALMASRDFPSSPSLCNRAGDKPIRVPPCLWNGIPLELLNTLLTWLNHLPSLLAWKIRSAFRDKPAKRCLRGMLVYLAFYSWCPLCN